MGSRWVTRLRRLAALFAIAALLVGSGGGMVLADDRDEDTDRGEDGRGLEDFDDLPSGHWAWPYVRQMGARGILFGYGDGRFGPQNPVSRAELVILATRLLGAELAALALDAHAVDDALAATFRDHDAIPDWPGAKACLAYALQKGYLWPLTVNGGGHISATAPATRAEVVVMLLEAGGLGSEARSLAGATLDFKDANTVPDWARGHLALAVRLRILSGRDGKLWPNEPVTRCEMAAIAGRFCERLEERLADRNHGEDEDDGDDDGDCECADDCDCDCGCDGEGNRDRIGQGLGRRILSGDVVAIRLSATPAPGSTITVVLEGPGSTRELVFPLAPGVVVMSGGVQGRLGDIAVGRLVTLYLDASGKVLLIDLAPAATHAADPVPAGQGVITAVTRDHQGKVTVLTVLVAASGGGTTPTTVIYLVSPSAVVTHDGRAVGQADVVVGAHVRLRVQSGYVVAIDIV